MDNSRKGKINGGRLLAVDKHGSILSALVALQPNPLAYSPYGHRHAEGGLLSLLGFNGEYQDRVTGHYLLGTGYHRAFNPVLMRFNSPDSFGPFFELNGYAFLLGDPINDTDPSGHYPGRKTLRKVKAAAKNVAAAVSSFGAAGGLASPGPFSAATAVQRSEPVAGTSSQLTVPERKYSVVSNSSAHSQSVGSRKSSISSAAASAGPISEASTNARWTLNESSVSYKGTLTPASEIKRKAFTDAIKDQGLHPKLAADSIGDSNYKALDDRLNLYQIRLSGGQRMTFIVHKNADPANNITAYSVEIRQVGGHT